MEVFLNNVPAQLAARGLKRQLEPILAALSIHDWECWTARQKRIGTIVFLHAGEARDFLAKYGAEMTVNARLVIMNSLVLCRPSRNSVENWQLKHLLHEAEQRQNRVEEFTSNHDPIRFDIVNLSCGHYDVDSNGSTFMRDLTWPDQGHCRISLRYLTILFPGHMRLQIPVHAIREVVSGQSPPSMTVALTESPIMAKPVVLNPLQMLFLDNTKGPAWTRVTELDENHGKFAQHSLVYHFEIKSENYGQQLRRLIHREILPITSSNSVHAPLSSIYHQNLTTFDKEIRRHASQESLSFAVLFQLQKLVYNGYFSAAFVISLATSIKILTDQEGVRISADSIRRLMPSVPYSVSDVDTKFFEMENILSSLKQYEKQIQCDQWQSMGSLSTSVNMALIHQVLVTPTRITLDGPEWESNNRILRSFPDNHDCFIRVRFADENGDRLIFDSRMGQDNVYRRFKKVMREGLDIGGRKYCFLGFSHSSLRSQTAWFIAPFQVDGTLHDSSTVIGSIGNFLHITSPAKCAARIGQAFSETPAAVRLETHGVKISRIPDKQSCKGDGSVVRVFSDGVGTLSQDVVDLINKTHLGLSRGAATCFQIRYAGAKGMLSLDSTLEGHEVRLRPSMIKFESPDAKGLNLEICGAASRPIPLVLNRQMIKILEDMGMPASWFFKHQDQELQRLRDVLRNGFTIAAFLQRQDIGTAICLPQLYEALDTYQVQFRKDPFLRSVIEMATLGELRRLKYKARIPIRNGTTLYGVLDETGFLAEGEIYVAFDHFEDMSSGHLPDGNVLLTRSPALHPGDIQLVKQVNPPANSPLASLTNCIVFSQHGERDLPSMLSGGDLDGDIFNVIWDEEALSGGLTVSMPADYPRAQALDLGRPVEPRDMMEFFIDFMKADCLGVIATRHLILADQRDSGTLDGDCLTLANLHSLAVDFSKSGIPVDMKSLPRANRYRPDFLAATPPVDILPRHKINLDTSEQAMTFDDNDDYEGSTPQYQYYKSEKILGKLFRAIDEKQIWKCDIRKHDMTQGATSIWHDLHQLMVKRCDERGIRWQHRLQEAQILKDAYEDEVHNMMYNYSEHPTRPLSELEVFVGTVHNRRGAQTGRQQDKSRKLKEEMDRALTNLVQYIRLASQDSETHTRTVAPTSTNTTHGGAGRDASIGLSMACLEVSLTGIEEIKDHQQRRRVEKLVSFRVVAAAILHRELRSITLQ